MTVKTIFIKAPEHVVRKEGIALGAITPGMLIERAAGGVQAHGTAASNAAPAFAFERELTGGGIDDAYATDDTVLFGIAQPGVEVYAVVSGSVALGDFLESDGAGGLRTGAADAATDTAQRAAIVAVALAANVSTRCKVEVL